MSANREVKRVSDDEFRGNLVVKRSGQYLACERKLAADNIQGLLHRADCSRIDHHQPILFSQAVGNLLVVGETEVPQYSAQAPALTCPGCNSNIQLTLGQYALTKQ